MDFWKPAARAGWLVAAPQSHQALWKGAYVWDNQEVATAEIKRLYGSLLEQYSIDTERVILAGHGRGAALAMQLALTGQIPAMGFLAIAPGGGWIHDIDRWDEIIRAGQDRDLRGYVILGEEDENIPFEDIHSIVEMLNSAGIPCEIEVAPHAGHDYDPQYESSILRALEFIAQTG